MSGEDWTGKRLCEEAMEHCIVRSCIVRSIRLLARLPTRDARTTKAGKVISRRRALGKAADRGTP